MLLNCGVGEDSWESLGLQGDPTSPFWRRSALGFLWKEWCWSWNSSTLATSCEELTHWKRPWCWEGLGARGEEDDRGWDGWMASLTQWTWVSVNSRSWWWTERPGVLRFMGSQRVGHDWATDLIWSLPHQGALGTSHGSPCFHPALLQCWFTQQLHQSDYTISRPCSSHRPSTGFPPHSGRNQAPSCLLQSPAWTAPVLLISHSTMCCCVPALLPFFQLKSTIVLLTLDTHRSYFFCLESSSLPLFNWQTLKQFANLLECCFLRDAFPNSPAC